jgi:hypothetical protein
MLTYTACLSDFLEPVPVCQQTVGLAIVLEIFRQRQCDRLVLVNEHQQPVGSYSSKRFLNWECLWWSRCPG